jgi:plastocyanin
MTMVFHLRPFILALLSWVLFLPAEGQHNVTLDDQDPAIVYAPAGAWLRSANNSLDYGGAHMLTQNSAATATLNFTGEYSYSTLTILIIIKSINQV